jgi:hypothetical protein
MLPGALVAWPNVPRSRAGRRPLARGFGKVFARPRLRAHPQFFAQLRDQLGLFARLPRELAEDLSQLRTLARCSDQSRAPHAIELFGELPAAAHGSTKFDQRWRGVGLKSLGRIRLDDAVPVAAPCSLNSGGGSSGGAATANRTISESAALIFGGMAGAPETGRFSPLYARSRTAASAQNAFVRSERDQGRATTNSALRSLARAISRFRIEFRRHCRRKTRALVANF